MTLARTVSWIFVIAALGILTIVNPTQPGGPLLRDVSIASISNLAGNPVR